MTTTTTRTALVRACGDGKIQIPQEFLETMGIAEGELLRVVLKDGTLTVTRGRDEPNHGSPWLRELYEAFAPVRAEILARGISEEELNDAIDEAIAEVRAERRARQA